MTKTERDRVIAEWQENLSAWVQEDPHDPDFSKRYTEIACLGAIRFILEAAGRD